MTKPKATDPQDQNPGPPPTSGEARIDPGPPISSSDAQAPADKASTATDVAPQQQTTSKSPTATETPAESAEPNGPEPESSGGLSSSATSSATNDTKPTTQSAPPEVNNDVLAANVGDQPSPNDSLGFTPYVEAIASFLTNDVTKPPLTLSIEGEWGSGKSSFMLQLKERLRGKMSVVEFNAWRYDKDDAMWAAFALEFARKLAGDLPFYYRWWAHVKLFVKRFQWERGWIDMVRLLVMLIGVLIILLLPVLMWDRISTFVTSAESFNSILGKALGGIVWGGGILGYAGLIVLLWLKLKNTFGNPLKINLKQYLDTPDYKSRVAFIERFHQDFGNVAKTYGRGEKICVFIDDLDRCEVPKAADLMQALNLMITDDKDSQLIFIMGMDREKVAAGLAVKYEKLLPYLAPAPAGSISGVNTSFDPVRGLEYGYGFIEKFIQLPFHVPQAGDTQVEEFVKKLLSRNDSAPPETQTSSRSQSTAAGESAEKAVTENSEMVTEILKMVAPTLDYNPRRLKQFINAFRLKTFIASKLRLFPQAAEADKPDGLTIQQIGKFVAISLHWPLLLADLDSERDLLSRLQSLVLDNVPLAKLITKGEGEDKLATKISTNQGSVKVTPALYRWYGRDDLREFLRVKLFTQEGEVDDEAQRIYSLEKLDVNKLLQVSLIPVKTSEPPSPLNVPVLTTPPQQSVVA